jgi:cyclopropane-fatty-acyl-phospholipid synthase
MQASRVSLETSPGTRSDREADASLSDPRFDRLLALLQKACRDYYASGRGVPCTLRWRDGRIHTFGEGEPAFGVVVRDAAGVQAMSTLDGNAFLEAYAYGHLDIEGDMERLFAFRDMTSDKHPIEYLWNLVRPLLFGQVRADRSGIETHYDHSPEFYLAFLDRRHRCYSQGVFRSDDEPLEDAMTRKLDFALEAIGAKPGDRVLDIGGGWGAFCEHAGRRGIRVTSLTISGQSERFLRKLIADHKLPCDVVNAHVFEYRPAEPFDGIVNLGVTGHLPDYARSFETYRRLLKPGGRIYLDESACREKYRFHTFITRHIYPGNASPTCLHDYLAKLARTPFRLRGIWDDRHSYYLTARHWALNLERRQEEVVRAAGEAAFRKFQIYLWGTADCFKRDVMQAYRWVLELP